MTSTGEQLRSIAHSFDAADALRQAAVERLVEVALAMRDGSRIEPDSASAPVAVEDQPGSGGVVVTGPPASPAPIEWAGPPERVSAGSGLTSRPSTVPPGSVTCPGCDRDFPTQRHVGQHRRFCKGRAPTVPVEPAPEPFRSPRATPGERLRARDAARAGRPYPRAGASTFLGE